MSSLLRTRAQLLRDLGRDAEAIAAFNLLIRRFHAAWEPRVRENLAVAMVDCGDLLGRADEQERFDEAVAVYAELVRRFENADEPGLRERVDCARSEISDIRARSQASRPPAFP